MFLRDIAVGNFLTVCLEKKIGILGYYTQSHTWRNAFLIDDFSYIKGTQE